MHHASPLPTQHDRMLLLQEQLLPLPMHLKCCCSCCCCGSQLSCNLSVPKFYHTPAAAVPAEAQHCYSEFRVAVVVPVAAEIAADPVYAAPPAAKSPCLLHLLMLRIDVPIRCGEILARTRRRRCYCYRCWCWYCLLHAACVGCFCCCRCCWS